ncbi:MAG TPA: hypothetical protein PK440_09125 [Candidatus Accumulibacter phosphatis]|nr:MAG: hypothetical protein AW07_04704 [Candidatus Accumulibacter sp. SK-11]HAY27912.1 hypothetical protein [Accumulibacter sp.]HCN66721.1 hypothetical protein [Accumulibacter sp.]HRL74749.1 hypothetical protein [Candidatus Accumulibacter phosphatis]HRQ95146.1 hypothetical protein [Candidatus Accumulibacter phosphatis]
MKGIPQDLIFFLIFGAIVLFQILRAQWRRRRVRSPAAATPAPPAEEAEPEPAPLPRTASLPEVPRATTERVRTLPVSISGEAHRFSRRALLGSRRSMQSAIVIAAILQPCRARRPHEVE